MSEDLPPTPPASRRKNLLLALMLLAAMIVAVGYSASQSGLLSQLFPPGEEKLPRVDFKELHSRIEKPEELSYVKFIEDATLGEYDRANPKASAWYEEGRVAAQLFAFVTAQGDTYGEGLLALAERHANRAWNKSCRDPLILAVCDVYLYSYRDFHSNDSNGGNRHLANAQAMLASGYPVICKLETASVAMKNLLSLKHKEKPIDDLTAVVARIPAFFDETMKCLAGLIESAPPERIPYWKFDRLLSDIKNDALLLADAAERMDTILAAAKASGGQRAYCQGNAFISLAWAARGTGWANTVTQEGWRVMAQRLADARKALTEGAAAFPGNKWLPALMLTVELGDNTGPAGMDAWFQKSVAIDPDYPRPYKSKMYYLQPKWHGTPRAIVDFGRECLATGRWDACIPMVLVDGFAQLGTQYETLFEDATVWKLFRETSEEFLRRYPRSVLYHTKFFEAAVLGKHWDIARAQLKILGDHWDHSVLNEREFNERKAAIPGGA